MLRLFRSCHHLGHCHLFTLCDLGFLWQNTKMDRNAKEWKERKVQKNFNGRNGRKKIEQNATILCHELLFLKAIVNTSDSLPMSNRQFPIY